MEKNIVVNGVLKEIDEVSSPVHYTSSSIECIDAMIAAFGIEEVMSFCKCNVFKYTWRSKLKGGDVDMKKAKWYQEKWLELNKLLKK